MTLATARDLSIILLAIEAFVFALVIGAALYFVTRGMRRGNQWLRTIGFPEAQRYARLIAEQTQVYSDKVTRPIVQVETSTHRARRTVAAVPGLFRNRRSRR
ncbi:MAG: hypothetical protein K1X65_14730 [Caldilineales bacterium]|nr:hypothetical protein [Caldilineales bacterium]MCW5857533.1 hypothetical protein [Caldilineales bacterium]